MEDDEILITGVSASQAIVFSQPPLITLKLLVSENLCDKTEKGIFFFLELCMEIWCKVN